jgi:hypothetical protein
VNAHSPWPGSLPRAARQCRPLSRAGGAFRRWSPGRAPSRVPAPEPLLPLADGRRRCTCSSRFETATRPLSAPLSRASVGRVRFNDLCRSMFQRARRWTARAPGRTVRGRNGRRIDRSLPLDRRRPPKVLRVRGRGSPSLDAPSRDCSRERLRPGPDCFGHLLSRALPVRPCLDLTEATGKAAGAAGASKARAAAGR